MRKIVLFILLVMFGWLLFSEFEGSVRVTAEESAPKVRGHFFRFTNVSAKAGIQQRKNVGSHGIAFADVDNDGDLDFYITNTLSSPENVPNYLFINQGDGKFTQESRKRRVIDNDPGLDSVIGSHGVVFADFDRDGDRDLLLANAGFYDLGHARLFVNRGNGFFNDHTEKAGLADKPFASRGIAVADFNGDGDLDFVQTNSFDFYTIPEEPVATNRLFLGTRKLRFTAVNGGLLETGFSQGIISGDVNGDNSTDIIESCWPERNAGGRSNYLWLNDGTGNFKDASFTNIGPTFATDDTRYHGAVLGDTDNDGDLDLITIGDKLRFFVNNGKGKFTEMTEESGLEGNAFSVAMGDLDQDGDLDVIIPNSFGFYFIFENVGDNHFVLHDDTGVQPPAFNDPRAVALGDYDGDGDLDVVIAHKFNYLQLYRNNINSKNFIKLKLISPSGEQGAIGAKVRVYKAGEFRKRKKILAYREVFGSSGYLAQNDLDVHIGLASHRQRLDIEIRFADGTKMALFNVKPGRILTVDASKESTAEKSPAEEYEPIN